MLPPRLGALAAVLTVSACAQNDQDPITDQQAQVAKPGCTPPQCGRPTVIEPGCTYFWRLNTYGEPNDRGASIVEVRRADGRAMRIFAEVDQLRGVDPATNVTLAEHQGLVGTAIIVSINGSRRTIKIDRVTTGERFQVGAQSSIEAYDRCLPRHRIWRLPPRTSRSGLRTEPSAWICPGWRPPRPRAKTFWQGSPAFAASGCRPAAPCSLSGPARAVS